MRALSEAELLEAWERGLALRPARRALDLLTRTWDEEGADPGALSVGERDGRLLELRARIFGRRCDCRLACPACAEQLETEVDVADLLGDAGAGPEPFALTAGGYELLVRLPDGHDLIGVERCADSAAAAHALLERCVLSARRDGLGQDVGTLPAEVVSAIEDAMAERDPGADRRLALHCPACGHDWQAPFDALAFLWAELDAGARRTMHEVHLLASRYGWSEAEVLSVSPSRRSLYLEAAGA
ncbi:MAG: phage baseplate protein [Gemmatimonadales bacterium]